MKILPEPETIDTILGGRLTIVQPLCGYRFSLEAVLLGRFAQPRSRDRVLELGAGCGVISIIIATLARPREIVALELQPELSEMIVRNAELNGIENMTTVCADLRSRRIGQIRPGSFDYVVANPPYRAALSGRESPNAGRRIARGAGGAHLIDFVTAASRHLCHGGKAAFVFTAARSAELIAEMRAHSLEPKRIRFVHPTVQSRATTILVEARKGGGIETEIESPLFVYEKPGVYSDAARELLMMPARA
jgi:tRNA1Val (adenine37-N6)-methyltransferase